MLLLLTRQVLDGYLGAHACVRASVGCGMYGEYVCARVLSSYVRDAPAGLLVGALLGRVRSLICPREPVADFKA